MAFNNDEREAFLATLPDLGGGRSGTAAAAFVRDHRKACISEIGANPGFDQVRAGLIRSLAGELAGDERETVAQQAQAALDAFVPSLDDADPLLLLVRHPAWVAIASLELDRWRDAPRAQSLDRAVALATAGFTAIGDGQVTGRGEVLWAVAEQADDHGWTQTATTLYQAAVESPFSDASNRSQVQLLLALRWVEDKDPRGASLLAEVAEDGLASERARIHARWVLAAILNERGESAAALGLLEAARAEVDESEEPDVAERLDDAIGRLG